jgi:hypothetical protein
VRDDGIPDLRRAAQVHGRGHAGHRAVARGAEVVGLQLDGREADRALGQVGHAAVAGAGVGQRDDAACMQEAVGRHQLLAHGQLGMDFAALRARDLDAEITRQVLGTELVEMCAVGHGVSS